MLESLSLTVRIKGPLKRDLNELAKITERSMSYHAEKALEEYLRRERERVERLSHEIRVGVSSLDAGKGVKLSEELIENIKKRGRRRLAELNRDT